MADDNLFDVVAELRTIVADLKRTVYGDPATRSRGLMDEFDGLRADVNALRHDLERVKNRRPNVASWIFGYLLFCAAGLFATIYLISQVGYEVLGLPSNVSLGLAILFCLGALFLFVSGFGWFDRG